MGNGSPGKPGTDGRTPYFHVAYANSAEVKMGFDVSDKHWKRSTSGSIQIIRKPIALTPVPIHGQRLRENKEFRVEHIFLKAHHMLLSNARMAV